MKTRMQKLEWVLRESLCEMKWMSHHLEIEKLGREAYQWEFYDRYIDKLKKVIQNAESLVGE